MLLAGHAQRAPSMPGQPLPCRASCRPWSTMSAQTTTRAPQVQAFARCCADRSAAAGAAAAAEPRPRRSCCLYVLAHCTASSACRLSCQRCPTLVLPCRLPTALPPVQCCRGRTCRGRCRWGRWSNTWRRLRPTCEARPARRRQQQARRRQQQTRRRQQQQQQQQQLLLQQCQRAARLLRAAQPGRFTLSFAPTWWWVARCSHCYTYAC